MSDLPRLFISYATPDVKLAKAFANFVQLGADLKTEQVFITARPSTLPKGTPFVEAIRAGLDGATLAVLLLTPSYYQSQFCLAELGALWITQKHRVPIVVPPIDYADLDGVQLGEQAIRISSATGLDEMRDAITAALKSQVPTALWNEHKAEFLNRWDTEFADAIPEAELVPAEELIELEQRLADQTTELEDLRQKAIRLTDYSKNLAAQNAELRSRVDDAPPPPELEGHEDAQYIAEAETASLRASSSSPARSCAPNTPRSPSGSLFVRPRAIARCSVSSSASASRSPRIAARSRTSASMR